MQSRRIVICAFFLLISLAGSLLLLKKAMDAGSEERYLLAEARYRRDQRLYQLALEDYAALYAKAPSYDLYTEYLKTAEEYHADRGDGPSASAVRSILEKGTADYPKVAEYWERIAEDYRSGGQLQRAYDTIVASEREGVNSDKLTAMKRELYYAYRISGFGYELLTVTSMNSVFYAENSSGNQFILNGEGTIVLENRDLLGRPSENGFFLIQYSENELAIVDTRGIPFARFPGKAVRAFGLGSELIPILPPESKTWHYIGTDGSDKFGGFLTASTFQSGFAAVQAAANEWTLIDTEGNAREKYEEIRINEDGRWLINGRALAKSGGKWRICELREGTLHPVSDFACTGIGENWGAPIAFEDNGKWGFVSPDGSVVIPPTYAGAKSFRGGFGAVNDGSGWGFLDGSLRIAVPCTLFDVGYFRPGSSVCPVRAEETSRWQLLTWSVKR